MRRKTRSVKVGNLEIGGNAPISVQSMTNTDTKNITDTVSQIKRMEKEGCELVRVAVPDLESCYSLPLIKKEIKLS
jgi:(E)-4-hydroxy-3-methylbut-2-enyl-diphosphate synthase